MDTEADIKRVVRERYASAAATSERCCGATAGKGPAQPELGLDMIGDAYKAVDGYVATPISASAAGCRHSTRESSPATSSLISAPEPASTPSWQGASLARRGV